MANIFDSFTNLYSLSKTLRFELRPLPETREFLEMDKLEKEKLFPKDREKADNYQKIKYYLDFLHKEFIQQALSKFKKENINFESYYKNSEESNAEGEEDNSNEVDQENTKEKNLRKKIINNFKESGFLFDKKVIDELGKRFQQRNGQVFLLKNENTGEMEEIKDAPLIVFANTEGKEETIFQNFKGFTGYLKGFHENRKNLYKDDGKAGRVATRIIDQNLPKFLENLENKDNLGEIAGKYEELQKNFNNSWEDYFREKKLNTLEIVKSFAQDGYNWQKVFECNFYNFCLLQKDIEFYNYVVRKLNKDINEYRQKLKAEKKDEDKTAKDGKKEDNKKNKLPFFSELYKQILGEVKKKSDFIEITEENIWKEMKNFIEHSNKKLDLSNRIIQQNFLERTSDFTGIYFSQRAINTISSKWFTGWDFFGGKILDKENEGLVESKKRKKIADFVSFETVKNVLDDLSDVDKGEIFKKEYSHNLEEGQHWNNFLTIWKTEFEELKNEYDSTKIILGGELQNEYCGSKDQKQKVKNFADASLNIFQMTKYFALLKGIKEVNRNDKNTDFYLYMDWYLFGGEDFEGNKYEECNIYEYYNAFRNFLTQKPWSEGKIKLNFENGSPLKCGTRTLIFRNRKGNIFYLGIIRDKVGKIKDFEVSEKNRVFSPDEESFQQMIYKQLKFQTLAGMAYIRDFGKKYSEDKNGIENLKILIKKQFILKYPNLQKIVDTKYENKKIFDADIGKCLLECYSLDFVAIEKGFVFEKVYNKELLLFEISSKDFNKTTSNRNFNTLYFESIFSNGSSSSVIPFKLNNEGAEVFFREATHEHKLGKKKDKKGKEIIDHKRYAENKIFLHLPITLNFGAGDGKYLQLNEKLNQNIFQDADLSKRIKIIGIDRGEKHLAYYSVIDQQGRILDQGTFNRIHEKDRNGKPIIKSEKLIVPIKDENGKTEKYILQDTGNKVSYTDYLPLLECKEKNRLLQRKSWDSIESIKDLKNGFISHVVHQLCELIFKYLEEDGVPPIIVFENLNIGFKQGRQKIERQIYQNLEIDLAKKLNYLIKKEKGESEIGGIIKALQLTPMINNYGSDIEKKSQVGIILYTDPSYTSAICPDCGFRKRVTKTKYESVKKAIKKIQENNIKLVYENGKYAFSFTTRQTKKDSEEEVKMTDMVYSDVSRLFWNGEKKKMDKIENITTKLDEIFQRLKGTHGIEINKDHEITAQILNLDDKKYSGLWSGLMWCFCLILQVRNSENIKFYRDEKSGEIKEEGENRDYIQCPRCYFHSEKDETWNNFKKFFPEEIRKKITERKEDIFNGDANGAYNIARKGILMLRSIKNHPHKIKIFQNLHNINDEELKKKFKNPKNKGKYEIIEGSGRKKKVIDSISKYPELTVYNLDWDTAVQDWDKFITPTPPHA